MGSQHNPENGSGAAFPYSYGHYVNGNFRTVMSYVDPCPSGCTQRPYFSNPSVLFSGLPTGIEGTRDNARSINNTADIIANYRYSGTSITMNGYNGGEIIPRYMSRAVTWSSAGLCRQKCALRDIKNESTSRKNIIATPRTTDQQRRRSMFPTSKPTKNARLRITSIRSPTVSDSSIGNIAIK